MTTYERTLIAHGISPEAARRDALANELVRLTNREHPAYGVQDETIYGGGRTESGRADMARLDSGAAGQFPVPFGAGLRPAESTSRERGFANQIQSRSSALPASTLSPARCLTALPSRQVAGSYDDDELRKGFAFKYGLAQEAN